MSKASKNKYKCCIIKPTKDWEGFLARNGFYVFQNIIPPDRCDKYIADIWLWLSKFGYTRTSNKWPRNYRGIIKERGGSHQKFVWDIRSELNVVKAFSLLWNCKPEELVTSFDSIGLVRPGMDWKAWNHNDQVTPVKPVYKDSIISRMGAEHIQGIVNLEHTDPTSSSFVCWPRTHLLFPKTNPQKGFVLKSTKFLEYIGYKPWKILVPKGGMIIFDSRLVHCNAPPLPECKLFRYVIYVCMTRRDKLTSTELEQKRIYYKKKLATNHDGSVAKQSGRNVSNKKDPTIVLTPLQKKLAGF